MNQKIRLALVGLNQTPMDWKGNMRRIRRARDRARERGARIVVFPELAVSGYGCEDMFLHPDTGHRSLKLVAELARECGDEVWVLGLPFWHEEQLYNGVAVLNRGKIRAITAKCHLARDGIHYEPRWFHAWSAGEKSTIEIDGESVPIGTLSYSVNGLPFALEICEDAWVKPERRPCRLIKGAQWAFNASASHFSMRKADIRERIVKNSSSAFGIGYAYTNLVGLESGRAIYDGELLIAEKGVIVRRSDCLYLDQVRVIAHDIAYQADNHKTDVMLHAQGDPNQPPLHQPRRERSFTDPNREFAMAASLALLDYLRKSRSSGFTISLSGGVDSGTVAVLVWFMAHRLINELNLEQRKRKLSYLSDLDLDVSDANQLVGQLLTTVYQATRNSREVTRRAAAEVAAAIGARHHELDVDPLVEGYRAMIEAAIDRPLTWERDDVALQNIQARVRAPGVWMLANLNKSLLLSTSNRSEVAVGYATMDGDTCGGLAPIAGVEKTFLRRWLRIMESEGLPGAPPLPALAFINNQAPTAELRPPGLSQTDEADLMPYEILDRLEECLIARRLTPREAFNRLNESFGDQYGRERLKHWTAKFCRMFSYNQWKRERYAPGFHLDDRNLDPKTWARYPILSGAFEAELEDLASEP